MNIQAHLILPETTVPELGLHANSVGLSSFKVAWLAL